jgi:NADH-quinone oxidoreductase subunit A
LWPVGVYFVAVLGVIGGMIGVSYVLGPRHNDRATGEPYESGMLPTGTARLRMSSTFFLVAIFFVIFDLESIFIYAWAIAVRDLGWAGYGAISFFIALLFVALAYLWRERALD